MEEANTILKLYQKVAVRGGGIARFFGDTVINSHDQHYIDFKKSGKQLVIDARDNDGKMIAELFCFTPSQQAFSHVLTDLTIVVATGNDQKKLITILLARLLEHVESDRRDILRVEILVREEDAISMAVCKKFGFKLEGRFNKRICKSKGHFEAEIPMVWFNKKYIHRQDLQSN